MSTHTGSLAKLGEQTEPLSGTANSEAPRKELKASAAATPVRKNKPGGAANGKPAPKRSEWVKMLLHVTRRGHLYAGLMLLPWVFLYGITGFLFNHPTFWPDQPIVAITTDHTRGTPLEHLPPAVDLATEVLAAMNAQGGTQYTLLEPDKIQYPRGALSASILHADGKPYSIALLPNGTGSVRAGAPRNGGGGGGGSPLMGQSGPGPQSRNEPASTAEGTSERRPSRGRGRGGENSAGNGSGGRERGERPAPNGTKESGDGNVASVPTERSPRPAEHNAEPAAPFAVAGGVKLKNSPVELIRAGLPAVLARLDFAGAQVATVRLAPLSFKVSTDGQQWQVTYNPENGSISGRDVGQTPVAMEMSMRRFLLRLHTAHGYPADDYNMRWVWAVLVDVTSFMMVFWGISGIVMWWQIKRTRWLGGICLIISMAAAIYIGIGMHELLSAAGR